MATLLVSNKENIEPMEVVEPEQKKVSSKRDAKEHDEIQYLELIRRIMETGTVKGDRTGV